MGFRFSKSFKLGPARLNLSKRGLGMSVGAKGVRVGAGPRGSYTTVGIPGTGLSKITYGGSGRGRAGRVDAASQAAAAGRCSGALALACLS